MRYLILLLALCPSLVLAQPVQPDDGAQAKNYFERGMAHFQLEEWDAVRVPPGMWRGYEAGPQGLEILVVGAPNLGEDPRDDVEGQRDWWG